MFPAIRAIALALTAAQLTACDTAGGLNSSAGGVYAPGLAESGKADVDGLTVGHRLMEAGEFELALRAYNRAALEQGLNVDTLSAMGSANLRLGRLGQAETLLRRAVAEDASFAAAWNNLGVILMERNEIGEAAEVFRRAYATDNGNSDRIRDNLRLALAKLDDPGYVDPNGTEEFQLVRRGTSEYQILAAL